MQKEMLDLANALIRSSKKHETQHFTIPGSTDHVVVTVSRVDDSRKILGMTKLSEQMTLVPYGSGQTCGACGGSGRV